MKTNGLSALGSLFMGCLLAQQALATESRVIARCYGDHHGSYLTVREVVGTEGLAQLLVIRTDDAVNISIYEAVEMSKNGEVLQKKAYSWAFRQVVKSLADNTWYGNVRVRLVDRQSNSRMLLDLQRYVLPIESAMLIDERIESLTCQLHE